MKGLVMQELDSSLPMYADYDRGSCTASFPPPPYQRFQHELVQSYSGCNYASNLGEEQGILYQTFHLTLCFCPSCLLSGGGKLKMSSPKTTKPLSCVCLGRGGTD
ncbi:autophagy 8 [Platysternon megacephalum]|uniref:Autophagy 8 n=1 Tax=Platysternon megacephalum TaxID=55544 RepID=A0A4D9DJ20_9SAUR|nr:autophagy 8 [Platysternon megacephalum]